jgi:cohesin loading factor subunit SCC2
MNRRRCGLTADFLNFAFDDFLQDDVNYTRYMAENFATFDYKTQEEVFTVIKSLTSVLSTTGMQLLEIISPSHLLTTLHETSQPEVIVPVESTTVGYSPCREYLKLSLSHRTMLWTLSLQKVDGNFLDVSPLTHFAVAASTKEYDKVQLMRTSVIIAMVMLLKAHLKTLYSLSEE